MVHYKISINGRVQGVFFRDFVRKKARYLGIKGFVKNESDGSVYIEAEGEYDEMKEFIKFCKRGPEMAEVEKLNVEEGEMKYYYSFDVSY